MSRTGGRAAFMQARSSAADTTPTVTVEEVRGWFTGRLPADWFTGAPTVTVDRDEILVTGPLAPPTSAPDAGEAEQAAAAAGRAKEFRERTREARMAIAREAEHRFGRTVSWGVTLGEQTLAFTTASVPVMTRLRQPERQVLDTLIDAGVARSRSEALVWAVRLVGRNAEPWLAQLRDALTEVERLRAEGPEQA